MRATTHAQLLRAHLHDDKVQRGKNTTSDWLRLLSPQNFEELRSSITAEGPISLLQELVCLEQPNRTEFSAAELSSNLSLICRLESLRRNGLLRDFRASVTSGLVEGLAISPDGMAQGEILLSEGSGPGPLP